MAGVNVPFTRPSTSASSPTRSTASIATCRSCATRTAGPTSRREVGGPLVGGFEPEAKPWVAPDAIPYPFEFQLLDEDWEHFEVHGLPQCIGCLVLAHTGIRKFYNGPESFTPDNQFIIGEAPECDAFFVAAGFNSVGIASAGVRARRWPSGSSRGAPAGPHRPGHPQVHPAAGQPDLVARERVVEVLGLHYAVPWPNREFESGRPQRYRPRTTARRPGCPPGQPQRLGARQCSHLPAPPAS